MLRDFLRREARRFGIEGNAAFLKLKRFYPKPSQMDRLVKMLEHHRVTAVFDVGANVGQFAKELRMAGYRNRIVSFEPLSGLHTRLTRAATGDPSWIVAPRMAIGNHDGTIEINVAGDGVSSSVLDMLEVHVAAAPDSAYIGKEQVSIRKLDSIAKDYAQDADVIFLKADVQGFESQVLEGAAEMFSRIVGLHLELALVPCYSGQLQFADTVNELRSRGLHLWSLSDGTVEESTGRQLQADAVFFREP
ncbi:MAG: FkbM family methyltransferase [Terracidiphilus sp.]|jgi:FkbM family methyltransferase